MRLQLKIWLGRVAPWVQFPSTLLVALLQRTPVLRVAAVTEDFVLASPIGALLKSAVGLGAGLGAVDALAGATTYSLSTNSHASPYTVATGSQIAAVAFAVVPTQNPADYWTIGGQFPPGLAFGSATAPGTLTSPGTLNTSTPILSGTPTTPGTYTMTLAAVYTATNTNSGNIPYTVVVINSGQSAPEIATQPSSQSILAGQSATFTVAAAGTAPFTYQWTFNGSAISGANSASYSIASAATSNAGSYAVIVTNVSGSITSSSATLTVTASGVPAFIVQPSSFTIAAPNTTIFNALASGNPSPSYQWKLNGAAIASATSPTLVIASAQASNAGTYTCVASNSVGSATSNAATLTVISTTNSGRLTNLSTRAMVGTGGNILIVGFALGGAGTSGSKPMLIRGSGPALTTFQVTGVLPDPVLTLYLGSTLEDSNVGWSTNPQAAQITAEDTALGAFTLMPGSADSALFDTLLTPNTYSAQIGGKSGDTGVALAEVYDATASYTLSTPRLTNLSARVQVGTGGNILIAGFAIGGTTAKTVLIRASGPALIPFSVSGTLPDPELQLFSGVFVFGANTGWGGSPQIAAAASQVGAFKWSDPSSADSALLVTLPPGTYSAQVSGASGDTGVALVEVYEVP